MCLLHFSVSLCWHVALLPVFICFGVYPFPQPYFSTRLNAADIESRVKQLDQTLDNMDGADKKIKAGFWEEFDVSGMFKGYSPRAVDESQVLRPLEAWRHFINSLWDLFWKYCSNGTQKKINWNILIWNSCFSFKIKCFILWTSLKNTLYIIYTLWYCIYDTIFVRFFLFCQICDDALNHYWTNMSIDLSRRNHNYKNRN